MIILQATPLSQNFLVAVLEALILLAVAAYIGWWIARRQLAARIESLQADIRAKRADLDDCRRTPAPVAARAVVKKTTDDLKMIEGIGPKIEELLKKDGISTFAKLANTSAERIKAILDAGGPRFQMHDPTTWPQQSAMARDGKWNELKAWQDELYKGRLE
ncbi:MAG: hypothetical protein EAZ32_19705 [Cytophagia bacterium]|nr:MAG: hypothetical protein EAZ46_12575 [Runella sp.]TAG23889.1 MAG: hypothetical protein EAZ38_02345 [Cytophagales bacterium]TAG34415.1 MAG: hypothetical protein EAZ32_19705 [Cytophagia bacterium]TAG74827.1 MAG: hypothetical protein EAZ26_01665 [Runella slithyformis]TAG76645.1 MAG: hypothetical protein EAZ22_17560 [Cytophagales bacterium]